MAIRKNRRDVPPGGWRFVELATGARFSATSEAALYSEVAAHRKYKGLPLETIEQDVEDQICMQLAEGDCTPRPGEDFQSIPDKTRTLTTDMVLSVNRALFEFVKAGAKFVDSEVAEARADVCRRCPYNKPAASCSCHAAYRMIAVLLPTSRVPDGVDVCAACGCSLKAKTLLPDDVLIKSFPEGAKYPHWCWQHKLLPRIQKTDTTD